MVSVSVPSVRVTVVVSVVVPTVFSSLSMRVTNMAVSTEVSYADLSRVMDSAGLMIRPLDEVTWMMVPALVEVPVRVRAPVMRVTVESVVRLPLTVVVPVIVNVPAPACDRL